LRLFGFFPTEFRFQYPARLGYMTCASGFKEADALQAALQDDISAELTKPFDTSWEQHPIASASFASVTLVDGWPSIGGWFGILLYLLTLSTCSVVHAALIGAVSSPLLRASSLQYCSQVHMGAVSVKKHELPHMCCFRPKGAQIAWQESVWAASGELPA
jgi:hypothetical protein